MSMSPIKQPLHIAKKDAIHLWPETLVSILIVVSFAWMQSKSWPTTDTFDPSPFVTGLLGFLIPVSWLVLLSRLVHDEELVGDRQFWTTRPYTWYGLLGAKVLYLVVFVLLPFALTQAWMLHHAGLYPTHNLPGILSNVLHIALAVLLPLLAIAAVTGTFVRYILSALGALLYMVVMLMVIFRNWGEKITAPFVDWPLGILCLGVLLAAILVQYARRKTLLARVLLAALPLAFAALVAITPLNWLNEHRYPATNLGTLSLVPGMVPPQSETPLLVIRDRVLLEVPVMVSLPADANRAYVQATAMRVTLDGPGNLHYVSDWMPANTTFGSRPAQPLPLILPSDIYNKVQGKPVALHVTFGVQSYTNATAYTVPADTKPFPIPGHANCKLVDAGGTECTFPFKVPEFSSVSATVHGVDCANQGPESAVASGGLAPTQLSIGFALGLTPVGVAPLEMGVGQRQVALCPKTPVTFVPAVAGSYARMQLDIPSITLDPYATHMKPKPTEQAPQQ